MKKEERKEKKVGLLFEDFALFSRFVYIQRSSFFHFSLFIFHS